MEEGHVKRVQRDGSYGLWVEGNVSSLGGELQLSATDLGLIGHVLVDIPKTKDEVPIRFVAPPSSSEAVCFPHQ